MIAPPAPSDDETGPVCARLATAIGTPFAVHCAAPAPLTRWAKTSPPLNGFSLRGSDQATIAPPAPSDTSSRAYAAWLAGLTGIPLADHWASPAASRRCM